MFNFLNPSIRNCWHKHNFHISGNHCLIRYNSLSVYTWQVLFLVILSKTLVKILYLSVHIVSFPKSILGSENINYLQLIQNLQLNSVFKDLIAMKHYQKWGQRFSFMPSLNILSRGSQGFCYLMCENRLENILPSCLREITTIHIFCHKEQIGAQPSAASLNLPLHS